jgi:hypothetical protein
MKVMIPNVLMPQMKTTYISVNRPSILEWVQGWGEWNNKIKVIKFASIFMLLSKGKPMTNYEDFKTLFSFLKFKNNLEKY